MLKNCVKWFCLFAAVCFVPLGIADEGTLLSDGSLIAGIDGKVAADTENGEWFFQLQEDVNGHLGRVQAGAKLRLLESSTLEQLTYDFKERSRGEYKIWARVTSYEGRNCLFPVYYIPLSGLKKSQQELENLKQKVEAKPAEQEQVEKKPVKTKPKKQQTNNEPNLSEPEDEVVIPEELMEKFKTRKTFQPEQFTKKQTQKKNKKVDAKTEGNSELTEEQKLKEIEVEQDRILADRVAILQKSSHGGYEFVLDGLGWNVSKVSFKVLPSQVLELAQRRQGNVPVTIRFKISGIVTVYKGELYLLLQRAVRTYSYQNF